MNPYFTKNHYLLVSILFSLLCIFFVVLYFSLDDPSVFFMIVIITLCFDILTITQIAQMDVDNKILRKWFVIIIIFGLFSWPFVYRKFY